MKDFKVCRYALVVAIAGLCSHSMDSVLAFPEIYAFQNPCAERGNTRRHDRVLNPLQNHKVICSSADENFQAPPMEATFSNSITLCNWNVYGLPVKQSGRRQKNISDYIAYGCDIFNGQEHWVAFDRSGFRGRARNHFPAWNFKYFGHPVPIHPGSGIMIGSIWPITKTKYSPWPGGVIRNAGYKGVGYAQIDTPHGLIDVYNLHVAAGRALALKEKQMTHLVRFVQRTHDPKLPLIITGDFNFNQRWKLPSKKINALDWLKEKLSVRPVGFKTRIEYTLVNDRFDYLDHRLLADWATPRENYMSEPFLREFGDHPGIVTRVLIRN